MPDPGDSTAAEAETEPEGDAIERGDVKLAVPLPLPLPLLCRVPTPAGLWSSADVESDETRGAAELLDAAGAGKE